MLTIYRRHQDRCPHRERGRKHRHCKCPIWVDGFIGRQEIRKSTGLRDWQKAQDLIREWEARGTPPKNPDQESGFITVEQAREGFEKDAEARGLRESTLKKYRVLFKQLQVFARLQGIIFVKQFDLTQLRKFRESWADSGISAQKKLERLRAFFRFLHESGWIAENPSKKITNPKIRSIPTLPFSREEIIKILTACEKYRDEAGLGATRVRTFILFLRYSGLRIGDAATCKRDRLVGDRLFLYTQKTGVPVNLKLPPFLVELLTNLPSISTDFFFWTGVGTKETVAGNWRRTMRKVFKLAGIENGHPHRFRDTYVIELLLAGMPIEHVSVLLGHSSIRITERHYSPWIRARQEQLEAEIQRSWASDPIIFREDGGTRKVRGKIEVVN
jgi:integrase/recombinase XerD